MDVSDILGERPIGERRQTAHTSHKPTAQKKPDGVSREVFALTAGMPCVVPTSSGAYKERRNMGAAVPWRWREFTNPGRGDDAKLFHWAKKHDTDEYYFAKYNKTMTIDTYSDAEYDEHLQDPAWTKQQTDELMELAKRFDTRFIVMADRLGFEKSVEDVKERYYSVAQKLLELHQDEMDDDLSRNPLARFKYDREYEVKRKEQLNQILSRTVRDMAEEHMLVRELQAIDSTTKKDQKLRAKARKTAESMAGAVPSGTGTRSKDSNKRMRISAGGAINKTLVVKVKGTGVQSDRKSPCRKSQMTTEPSKTNEAQVLQRLKTLGVPAWPLPMANVCAAHAELVQDVAKLMALEKKLAKKKHI